MKKTLVLALIALASATAATAADEAPQAANSEKKICRTEPVTGSRTRVTRICMTEAQWRDLAADTKKDVDDFSSRMTSVREGAGQAQ